jgi:hypothetical protein
MIGMGQVKGIDKAGTLEHAVTTHATCVRYRYMGGTLLKKDSLDLDLSNTQNTFLEAHARKYHHHLGARTQTNDVFNKT